MGEIGGVQTVAAVERPLETDELEPDLTKGEDRGVTLVPVCVFHIVVCKGDLSSVEDHRPPPRKIANPGFVVKHSSFSDGPSVVHRYDLKKLGSSGGEKRDPGLSGPQGEQRLAIRVKSQWLALRHRHE